MFKAIIDAIRSLFASIFGTRKQQTTPERPVTPPVADASEALIPQDGSEVQPDTAIIANEMDFVAAPILPDDAGEDFETDLFDKKKTPEIESGQPASNQPIPPEVQPVVILPVEPKPTVSTPTPSAEPKPRYLWCLDNGHGKQTPGKRSPQLDDSGKRFFEYEFNRDIVRRIILQLEEAGVKHFNVVPEVEGDISLPERVGRANNKKSTLPKLYVSVHANASPAPSMNAFGPENTSGIETWYYHDSKRGRKLASIFQKYLIEETGFKNRHIKSQVKGEFYVLRKTNMTSILTENGFYNNKKEVAELNKDEVRQQIADAHVQAILEVEKEGL